MLKLEKDHTKSKTRSEVSGRSKKPFSQKGTGNARQGSNKPPNFRGGAVSNGSVTIEITRLILIRKKKISYQISVVCKIN